MNIPNTQLTRETNDSNSAILKEQAILPDKFQIGVDSVLKQLSMDEFTSKKRKFEELESSSPPLSDRQVKQKISADNFSEEIFLRNGDRYLFNTVNGKREGPAIGYLKNGNTLEITFMKDVLQGAACMTHKEDDKILFDYRHNVMQGEATEIKSSGQIIKFMYVNGVKEGKAFLTHSSLGIKLEYFYRQGIKEGSAILTVHDKLTLNFSFIDGYPEGAAEYICEKFRLHFNFEDGIREGFATLYPAKGEAVDIFFKQGKAFPVNNTSQVFEQQQPLKEKPQEISSNSTILKKVENIQDPSLEKNDRCENNEEYNISSVGTSDFDDWLEQDVSWDEFVSYFDV